jgi:NCS2 family nucleobase:cation symporter-2
MLAVKLGGLPLLFGMTGFVGVVEALFSRVMHRLRFLFPSDVTGLIVTMVGIVMVPISVRNFLGLSGDDTIIQAEEVGVAVITLALMVALNIYSKGKLRLYCILIGMTGGYLLSYLFSIIPGADVTSVQKATFFSLPTMDHLRWDFDFRLLIPFVIAALCSSLKTVGDLVTCQRINDVDWKRPEMHSIGGGILADGIGGIIPGLLGGFGQSTSSSNVGLSIATGATSRVIGYASGIILITMAFLPKLTQIFIIMPKPVIGATLIFVVSFMIVAGLQIIMSRMLDARKTFVIGISLIMGLSADILPEAYQNIHHWLQPIFSSSLSLAAVTAVVLNLVFRLGIAKHKTLELSPGAKGSEEILAFMESQGGSWGARKEIIYKAISAMNEFWESLNSSGLCKDKVSMEIRYDELNLDINIHYQGALMEFPEASPEVADLLRDSEALARFSGSLIRSYVDIISSEEKKGRCHVHFHFDH